MYATAGPGQDLAKVEKALDEELARFLAQGPTRAELDRAKTEIRAAFMRGVEQVGGFRGKSSILAENAVYGGRPDFYKHSLELLTLGHAATGRRDRAHLDQGRTARARGTAVLARR